MTTPSGFRRRTSASYSTGSEGPQTAVVVASTVPSRPISESTAAPAGLATKLQFLKGVGPKRAHLLEKKGLETVEDALYFVPLRHEDRTKLTPLASLQPGQVVTATGVIRML